MPAVTAQAERGFTLLELVLVVVLLGVLSAYAASRWSQDDAALGPQADRLAAAVRHVQTLAMTRGQRLTLKVAVGNDRYEVRDPLNKFVIDPVSGAPYSVVLDGNTTISGADTEFDGLGRPNSGGVLISAPVSYVLSTAARSSNVTIAPVSGFVTVSP